MHKPGLPKEVSSLFIFVPVMALGIYLVYLAVTVPFTMGRNTGLAKAPFVVPPKDTNAPVEVFDQRTLVQPSAELIALGARVYRANCASCHGDQGLGNGASGVNLAVKPRNFHLPSSDWKNGASVLNMYHTLERGLGSMPNFPALNPKQKYAVIHYIHDAFMKEVGYPPDPPEALAALPGPSADTGGGLPDPYTTDANRVAVRVVLDRLAEPPPAPVSRSSARPLDGLGRSIYMKNCASCHGPQGEGVMPRRLVGSSGAQLRALAQSSSLLAPDAKWAGDFDHFRHIVANGVPGTVKPGHPTLTESELLALYNFTLSLR
jgi:mono/diheme cytochrome c family protein